MLKFNIILSLILILLSVSYTFGESDGKKTSLYDGYYTLRNLRIMCLRTRCNHFILQPLNQDSTQSFGAEEIEFKIDGIADDRVNSSEVFSSRTPVILKGAMNGTKFIATSIFKLVPITSNNLNQPNQSIQGTFYKLQGAGFGACRSLSNCQALALNKLNSQTRILIHGIDNPYLSQSLLDNNWLNYTLLAKEPQRSIVQASLDDKNVAHIQGVYVNYPDPVEKCQVEDSQCGGEMIRTYTRTETRCLTNSECVSHGPCPLFVPECTDGYRLTSFPSGKNGCPKYYCDPDFVDSV